MKKKIILIIASVIFSVPILSGCYDYKEPNDTAYIVAIGIDESDNEDIYNFTLQFARPSQISGGSSEEGGSGKDIIGFVNVDAPSIYTALNLANHAVSKTFTLSHTKIIVISDALAKKGIESFIECSGRSSDIRPSVFLCISNGDAQTYLKKIKPTIEINPVKYYRLIFENPNSSYIPKMNIWNVYFNMKSNTKQNTVPLVGVSKVQSGDESEEQSSSQNDMQNSESSGGGQGGEEGGEGGEQQEGQNGGKEGSDSQAEGQQENQNNETESENKDIPINKEGFDYNMKQYVAGKLDIKKQNDSEVIGSAVFRGDKMIGELSNIENEIYNILSGDYRNGYSVIYSEKSPHHPTTVRLEQKRKPIIKVDTSSDSPHIKIDVALEGAFVSVSAEYPIEKDIEEFEKETNKYMNQAFMKFLNKTKNELDSDILGYGKYAKKSFLTNDDYDNYNWNEKYKNAEFDLNLDFKIRKTGLIIRN